MGLSQIEMDEIMDTYSIEMERMFDVVAGHYGREHHVDHALLLPAIEERIRTSLKPIAE